MKLELSRNRDLWAGVMFSATGMGAIFIARDYEFGSVSLMGPGFFPTLLGSVLGIFGICIILVGLRTKEKIQRHLSLRAFVLLPGSLVLFGALLERAGFIPASVALVLISAAAGKDFKLTESLVLMTFLLVLSWAIFIWGIGLPYRLIRGL